jgi:hypothetical protein
MTVAKLITQSQACPADLDVIIASCEQGYDPVTDLSEITIEKTDKWFLRVRPHQDIRGSRVPLP